ncbi:MAG: hypothetical protein HY555_03630 [Euryarchaeota archaeon]|nr:hypothetical protein [Euryarchaeota archaeon]
MKRVVALAFFLGLVALWGPSLGEENPYISSEVCKACHGAIYDQWSHSLHARSHEDPVFTAAHLQSIEYAGPGATPYCFSCHAPTTRVTKDYELRMNITREGVTCNFCHTVSGLEIDKPIKYLLSPGETIYGKAVNKTAPHRLEYREFFLKSEFCGGCHDLYVNNAPVMETYTEWKAGPYAATKQCQDCHMDVIEGGRSHRFTGGHFESRVKEAAGVRLETEIKAGKALVTAYVTNKGSGHKIPTGIPSRRLILHLKAKDDRGNIIYREDRYYRKVIADKEGREIAEDFRFMLDSAKVLSDNRIAPMETRVETFTFPVPSTTGQVYTEASLEYSYKPIILMPTEISVIMAENSTIRAGFPVEIPEGQKGISGYTKVLWGALVLLIILVVAVEALRWRKGKRD